MKRLIAAAMCLILLFALTACSSGNTADDGERLPKAFGIIKNGTKLEKHGKKNESTPFDESEFESALGSDMTYITVTELPESDDGVLMFRGAGVIKGQTLPASQLNYLRFVPTNDSEKGIFDFTCDAKGWIGTTLTCAITLAESDNIAPVAADSAMVTLSGVKCSGKLQMTDPDGDDVTVSILTYPKKGETEIMPDGTVYYTPDDGFTGRDQLTYMLTDKYGAVSDKATVTITVNANESGIFFADMQDDPAHLAAISLCADNVMTYKYVDGEYVFDPDGEIKKIDFLVMTMCAAGLSDSVNAVADSVISDDNGLSSGLKGFLATAADKGIITLDNGAFHPNASITYSEAGAMVAAALSIPAFETAGTVGGENDVISALKREGIIDEDSPHEGGLTRRECALMLYNANAYINNLK